MKKHHFIQHVPNCVDIPREEYIEFDFDTVEELLSNKYVQRFSNHQGFSHFAKSPSSYIGGKCSIMEVSDGGYKWWVVGHITNYEDLDLPIWEAKYKDKK